MARDTDHNYRHGSEKKRDQFFNKYNHQYTKRNLNTGKFMNNSSNRFKGVLRNHNRKKGGLEVSDSGIVLTYTITKASIHDIKMVKTLVNEYPCPRILADEGYISKKLKTY